MALFHHLKDKKGPGTSPIAESGGFLSTRAGLAAPDIQLHFLPVLVIDHGRTIVKRNGYSLHVCTLRPESAGTIRLYSADPKAPPLIDANYLAERRDLDTLIAGVKMGREILAQSGLDPYRADEFQPDQQSRRMPRSNNGSAPRARRSITRSAPARWVPTTIQWPWSTIVAGYAASRDCAWSTPRHALPGRRQHQRAHHHDAERVAAFMQEP